MHQRFGNGQRDAGQAQIGDMLGVIGQRAQMIGVADGGDGDAVLAGARHDRVQRRHGDHRAQTAHRRPPPRKLRAVHVCLPVVPGTDRPA